MALSKYWELNTFPELIVNSDAVVVSRAEKATLSAAADAARLASDNKAIRVDVDALSTTDTTPPLSGTVGSPNATVNLTVDGNPYVATNNGDGTWSLADNTIAPALLVGTYDVAVTVTDPGGGAGSTPGTAKLVITV